MEAPTPRHANHRRGPDACLAECAGPGQGSDENQADRRGLGARIALFFREELAGWKRWEAIWLLVCCAVVLALSIYWHDTPMGIISAVTGIAYTVCNGKGKRIAFLFGMVNSLLYAIIAFNTSYYGETMLNALYYFPMMFYGIYSWGRHMNTRTHEVVKRYMTGRQRLIILAVCVVGTVVYGLMLGRLGDALPYVDAFTTFAGVVALIVAIKRYAEQWFMWTVINAVTVVMWGVAFSSGAESIATLIMWIVYLATGIIMWVKWHRELNG